MHCDNNIIPHFDQIPRGLSQIFKIMPQKRSDESEREIELLNNIAYRGKYLNGYDLRVFLFLLGQLSVNRKVAKKLNARHSDIVKLLDAKVDSDKRIIAPALDNWFAYTEVKKMLKFFDLEKKWSNGKVIGRSLMTLEDSYLCLNALRYEGRIIAMDYDRRWLIFNPIFSALIEKNLPLTTVDLNVAKVLARDANKLIIYYALCDKVNFGESVKMSIEDFFFLWYNKIESRQAKNKRIHFIAETLDEITKLSKDFKIISHSKTRFSVRRVKTLKRKKP
ncbi:MAG: hypothetical protein JHC31_16145 [Sulfurihydrogenibium sp.]|nr:hypothetical protein [Sulfurihydrogenibium sp.]